MQNRCAEIKIRAERRAGELLREMDKASGAAGNPGGQGAAIVRSHDDTTQSPTLSDLGINKNQSSRWQKLAGIPDEEFDSRIESAMASGRELTSKSAMVWASKSAVETDTARRVAPQKPTR